MDPLSITTGSIALAGTVAKTTIALTTFIRDVRDARGDIDTVSAELNSLNTILDLLVEDVESATRPLPPVLEARIGGVLSNCTRVVEDIQTCVKKHEGSRLQKGMRWVAVGKGDMQKLRSTLEAHKATLNLALDMISITTLQEVRDTAHDIKNDTIEIHNDTGDIKEDTARILEAIAELQQRLPPDDTPRAHMLQRYLDELTTYAESVIDGGSIKDFASDSDKDSLRRFDPEREPSPSFDLPSRPRIEQDEVEIRTQSREDAPDLQINATRSLQGFDTASTLRDDDQEQAAERSAPATNERPLSIRTRETTSSDLPAAKAHIIDIDSTAQLASLIQHTPFLAIQVDVPGSAINTANAPAFERHAALLVTSRAHVFARMDADQWPGSAGERHLGQPNETSTLVFFKKGKRQRDLEVHHATFATISEAMQRWVEETKGDIAVPKAADTGAPPRLPADTGTPERRPVQSNSLEEEPPPVPQQPVLFPPAELPTLNPDEMLDDAGPVTDSSIPSIDRSLLISSVDLFNRLRPWPVGDDLIIHPRAALKAFESLGFPDAIRERVMQLVNRDNRGGVGFGNFTTTMHLLHWIRYNPQWRAPDRMLQELYDNNQLGGPELSWYVDQKSASIQIGRPPTPEAPLEGPAAPLSRELEDFSGGKMAGEYPSSVSSASDTPGDSTRIFGVPLGDIPVQALAEVSLSFDRRKYRYRASATVPQCLYVCAQYLKRLNLPDCRYLNMFPARKENPSLKALYETSIPLHSLWDGHGTRMFGNPPQGFHGREAAWIIIHFLEELPTPLLSKREIPNYHSLRSNSPFKVGISESRGLAALQNMLLGLPPLKLGIFIALMEAVQIDWRNPHHSRKDSAELHRSVRGLVGRALFGESTEDYRNLAAFFVNVWPMVGLQMLGFERALECMSRREDGMLSLISRLT